MGNIVEDWLMHFFKHFMIMVESDIFGTLEQDYIYSKKFLREQNFASNTNIYLNINNIFYLISKHTDQQKGKNKKDI